MVRRGGFTLVVCALTGVLSGCAAVAAEEDSTSNAIDIQAQTQTQSPPPAQTQTTNATTPAAPATAPLPVDLAKIRESLSQPQVIKLGTSHIRFYAQVQAKTPTFMDLVGTFDLKRGAAPHASAMSGAEFASMTTPKEMYSEAGITATDMLQFALTNLAAQTLVRKAVDEIKNAHDAAEVAAIRARIDRELAALMGNGGGSE